MNNHLTPQDYTFMILRYLNKFKSLILPVNITDITHYCIKKSKKLDVGDEVEIRRIVETTLKALEKRGYLVNAGGESFCLIKSLSNLDTVIFDYPEIKFDYKKINEYLSNIDKRTRYSKFDNNTQEDDLIK